MDPVRLSLVVDLNLLKFAISEEPSSPAISNVSLLNVVPTDNGYEVVLGINNAGVVSGCVFRVKAKSGDTRKGVENCAEIGSVFEDILSVVIDIKLLDVDESCSWEVLEIGSRVLTTQFILFVLLALFLLFGFLFFLDLRSFAAH